MEEWIEERIMEGLSIKEQIIVNNNKVLFIKVYKDGCREGFNWGNNIKVT